MNKYGARKAVIDGITFDSQKEARRWQELKLMLRAGIISDLRRQVAFELIPAIKDDTGKVIQRPTHYVADFVYSENGNVVVEDVKSEATKTPLYNLKKKLMRWQYGIDVREV